MGDKSLDKDLLAVSGLQEAEVLEYGLETGH
jgi:hypothetical protein